MFARPISTSGVRNCVIAAAALLLAACNPFAVLEGSDEAVAEFHERAAAGDIEAIYADSSPAFQDNVTLKQLASLIAEVTNGPGLVESSEREGFNINTNNGVTTVNITMASEFARTSGTETFVFLQDGEDWLLEGYEYDTTQEDE